MTKNQNILWINESNSLKDILNKKIFSIVQSIFYMQNIKILDNDLNDFEEQMKK